MHLMVGHFQPSENVSNLGSSENHNTRNHP